MIKGKITARLLVLATLFLPISTHAWSQTGPLPQLPTADPYFEDLFHRSGSEGMVVVVVRGQEMWMQSYGQTAPRSHQKPTATSLVRLCSLTKIMTSDVLVKMVAEKRVALADPLQKFAPRNVTVPDRTVRGLSARPITLGDLATHTAGLPREIAYPDGDSGHFTFPDYKFRWEWLPGFRLRTLPGYAAHYSNIGYDLLGDALAAAAGEPYPQLFQERIAQPLGLKDTTVTPTASQCARLLIAGKNEGPCSNTTAAAGSGGMYSTANDMARWLKYLLGLPGVPVHQDPSATAVYIPAPQLRWIQGMGRAGIPTGIGLGWVHLNQPEDPDMIIEKTGGGAGFNTYIALSPSHHTGLFVAATDGRHAGIDIFHESNAVLTYLAGVSPTPETYLQLAAQDSHPDPAVHKHHRHADRTSPAHRTVSVSGN